jgi:hypothetical protein
MTIADLHRSQDIVTPDLAQQLAYYRHVDDAVTTDHEALIDLSASIRQIAEHTRDNFQEIASKFDLVAKVKQTAADIRKLEFALLRLETSVDEYVFALQQALLNKLPVNIISPVMLGNILRNVSLTLPEAYALAVDPTPQGLMWFYQNVQSSLITTLHGFLVVLAVPIKDVYRQYDLYKLYSFPREVANGTFVQYNVEREFLAIQRLHHTYVLFSEEELFKCPGRQPKICAVTQPIYGPEIKSCVLSLYLQSPTIREVCGRTGSTAAPPPTLQRHGSAVVYHFAVRKQVHVRCYQRGKWAATSLNLHGTGLLQNVSGCHFQTAGLQLFPVLSGTSHFNGAAPELYTPELPVIATPPEVRLLEEIANMSQLATVTDKLRSHRPGLELDQYVNAYTQTLSPPLVPGWHTPTIIVLATLVVLQVFFMWVLPYALLLIKTWFPSRTPTAQIDTPDAEASTSTSTCDAQPTDPSPQPRYVKHSLSAPVK